MSKKETARETKIRCILAYVQEMADKSLPEEYIDDLLAILQQYAQLLARWKV